MPGTGGVAAGSATNAGLNPPGKMMKSLLQLDRKNGLCPGTAVAAALTKVGSEFAVLRLNGFPPPVVGQGVKHNLLADCVHFPFI